MRRLWLRPRRFGPTNVRRSWPLGGSPTAMVVVHPRTGARRLPLPRRERQPMWLSCSLFRRRSRWRATECTGRLDLGDASVVETEHVAQDFVGVLAEQR